MISDQEIDDVPPTDEQEDDTPLFGLARWQLVTLIVALCFLAGVIGAYIAQPRGEKFNDVDVGFLSDMTYHHEGAVSMGFAYLDRDNDPLVGHFAREIVMSQSQEIALMNSLLEKAGDPESATDDVAMDWMGMPMQSQRMPGMATEGEFEQLKASTGAAADDLFTTRMIRHHLAGATMAEYAAKNGRNDRVRQMATKMATAQRSEIAEMTRARADLGLPPVDLSALQQELSHSHR